MKLTPDNLDEMDCRPGLPKTRIKLPERLEKLLAQAAERSELPADGPTVPRKPAGRLPVE